MCDVCSDVLTLLHSHDERVQDREGLHLNKAEVMMLVQYAHTWQQRQCMCCFKDYKNYERINNLVQVSVNLAIKVLYSLPDCEADTKAPSEAHLAQQKENVPEEKQEAARESETENQENDTEHKTPTQTDKSESDETVNKENENRTEEDDSKKVSEEEKENESEKKEEDGEQEKEKCEKMEVDEQEKTTDKKTQEEEEDELTDWNMEDKDRLLQFVAKVFLMNFPLYMAYKHSVHSSLEELSQQEASALNNYCELSDPEIPVYLLRNVCFFCDSNGINAIGQCFEKANPDSLPYTVAHTLITIIANLRLWMNIATVMQYIVPLRTPVIRYMCKLSDKDLRLAGTRNMTDLMWAAVKEPLETHVSFDKEGLDLAFKYFTCTTLTIRLAGITQINNQINMYNDIANNENLMEADSIGAQLANWLSENKIIEHIFGPNLHVEIIKQSQIVLNFLAIENRITNEHIDCIWAAGQLKHCSKQVHDILIPLIKNLEILPAHHLLKLVSGLEPSAHTEQTLYLASALIRFIWNQVSSSHGHLSAHHCSQQGYSSLQAEHMQKDGGCVRHNVSSDEQGESHDTEAEGSEEEEDPIIKVHQKRKQKSVKQCDRGKKLAPHRTIKHLHRPNRLRKEGGDGETDGSSLCAKSELSIISDESLPSDISEHEHCGHVRGHAREHGENTSEISDIDETEIDYSESSEDEESEICSRHHHHHHHHRATRGHHHHGHHHPHAHRAGQAHRGKCSIHAEDDEEEEEDEEESSEDEEEEEDEFADSEEEKIRGKLAEQSEDEKNVSKDTSEDSEMLRQVEVMQTTETEGAAGANTSRPRQMSGEGETEVYDSRQFIDRMHSHRHMQSDLIEDILSPDEASCNSSHVSTKSEKNMADFEGEDVASEDELASINAHAHQHFSHMQQHLANIASLYHGVPKDVLRQNSPQEKADPCGGFTVEDVCQQGNTLLWDLVQDDTAHLLPEGLATEAEKALCTLVCFSTDRKIRMQFIEACVENLANHRSVVVSLRLLPKLFSSFQQYRGGFDTHGVTMWAEKELGMMRHFFNNLVYSTETKSSETQLFPTLYTRSEEIQVELHFLSCIFSTGGSPDNFRLSLEQVDILWNCLATNPISSDECLHWFLQQAKSKDHHAMGLDTFKHIFCEKMPLLEPETISMTGLNLFTQLCQLANIANASLQNPLPEEQINGMNQLWGIALRAQNTDVSLTAIQYLNNYYINYGSGILEKEDEFVTRCMESLVTALSKIDQIPESNLLVIQRGLILLTNHLDSFRKRYAFHLRNWQLDKHGITSHQKCLQDKQCVPIRVVLQPAGSSEKTTIEMLSTDLIAELRAEVTRWWEALHRQHQLRQQQQQQQQVSVQQQQGSVLTPILGAMLGDGPIRMITLGQELTADLDEKTLAEMQFKDLQLVFVSVGANRPPRKHDGSTPASYLAPPPRDKLPMMLLLAEPHFGHIFGLLQQLSNLKCSHSDIDTQEELSLQTKARVLSRKVWELLMLLPTNPGMLAGFKSITQSEEKEGGDQKTVDWNSLLDPHSPHKLMYSLQIVESLSKAPKHKRRMVPHSHGDHLSDSFVTSTDSELSVDGHDLPEETWSRKFVSRGGLSHLFSIFLSGSLQAKDGDHWNEWNQECLGYLLKLLSQFAVCQSEQEASQDEVFDSFESPKKRIKKSKSLDKIMIPKLNQAMLKMIEIDPVQQILMDILYAAAMPRESNQWHTERWGRAEVVHYAMYFLVSWAHSSQEVQPALCSSSRFSCWLKRLILEAPEPYVRQESCRGIYRLCLGRTNQGQTGYAMLLPLMASLLTFLDDALKMKTLHKETPEEKEPYGPGCRDYFWLLCRLVDSLTEEDAQASWTQEDGVVNLDVLARQLSKSIKERGFLECRPNVQEDNGLIGLLNLLTVVIKHKPPFQSCTEGQDFLVEVFWCLFALPSPTQRFLPKCKSQVARSAAYDLLVEMVKASLDNYAILHDKILAQHTKDSHGAYPWDHWPHEDGRSKCGYVGLTNLGATCYMATCMQHLYMIPQARKSVLEAKVSQTLPVSADENKHEGTLLELKKMFAYLLESERKAYNPRSFCKVYTMDKQPLNTGEQKDMTEFFTDLISKLEEMSPELKKCVKNLFGGVITNNVVSLDCPHVSRTKEEFYTIRCQVADMKNLYESLDEVTVKDMLEGDNMYTCSKCQKKVRAEKRACFKKLPNILCFNTMRYTFNMVTMMKEKVNTHFSFPLRLDMAGYMEKHLIQKDRLTDVDGEKEEEDDEREEREGYEYELIGVTVHTGTADGGHYYSFIRDRINKNENGQDKWYLFNDAEVKPFDRAQIATECFGGEMTSKTYDSVTDKFMDFSFEKTNSAYMLFYERYKSDEEKADKQHIEEIKDEVEPTKFRVNLSQDLAEWIWQDNMNFLQDKNIFEHTYFGFMWQMCGYIPTTLPRDDPEKRVSLMATKLSASFVLETLIHSKEKPTMLQWIELLTKLFNSCQAACEWFLEHMAEDDWWPQQILIKCPNQVVRQMFQRLVIHVISQLKPVHENLYLHPLTHSESEEVDMSQLGNKSCVTRFIKRMLSIIEHGVKPQSKHLTEYFAFLLEFAKMGEEECMFLIQLSAVTTMINFYMGHKSQENYVEILSDDEEEEEEEVITLTEDKYRPQSLDKMISLISMLVEKSRGEDRQLNLTDRDYNSIVGGKGFPFLFSQIRDNINVRQTCNLIFSLCRWNDGLAHAIVQMIFGAIVKLSAEQCQPFFKLLSMLAEFMGGPPGMPPFTQYVLQKVWEVAEFCPQQCLEWLSTQVTRNKLAHSFTLRHMELWVEPYLLASSNVRVRTAAAALLVSLVPNNHFRQAFRSTRSLLSPHKDLSQMSQETVMVLHDVYEHLLRLMSRARHYVDSSTHGTMKLVSYFALLTYCLVSRTEKLMFSPFFMDLWTLFQPKLSEPPIATNHNKQALLIFWYQVCSDCPENVKLIVTNGHITKNIAFNYILADHDDQDVVLFNRCMLPAYYGILRMCCQQSRSFTRHLAQHQNIQWAFKNITPYPTQYTAAVDELFKMMRLMVTQFQDSSDDELKAIAHFRRTTIQLYLANLEARSGWQTLISAFKILTDSTEDQLLIIYHGGLCMLTEAFFTLHMMYHEATACHVTGDIVDLLTIMHPIIRQARSQSEKKVADMKSCLYSWKERMEFMRKLLTLLNSYTPPDIRQITLDVMKEIVLTFQNESLQTIVPILTHSHSSFQDHNMPIAVGPYFPKRGQKTIGSKANIRPPRPQFQMFLHSNQLEASKGVDENYDLALNEFFAGYHAFIDLLCRVAANQQNLNESVINLSAMVAYEGVPLHFHYFAKLWTEIYHLEHIEKNYIGTLCQSSFFIDYVDAVLLDERGSLNNHHIYQFFTNYFPKVHRQVMNDQAQSLLDSLVASITAEKSALERVQNEKDLKTIMQRVNGDLRAMLIIFSVQPPKELTSLLSESLHYILETCRTYQQQVEQEQQAKKQQQQQRQQNKRKSSESKPPDDASTSAADAKNVITENQASSEKSDEQKNACEEEQAESDKSGETPSKRRRTTSSGGSSEGEEKADKADSRTETESPQPSTSAEAADSPQPSTSAETSSGRKTNDSEDSSQSGSDEPGKESPRPIPREKPGWIEIVARNVEHIFNMCGGNK